MTVSDQCLVTVHARREGGSVAVDLALPSRVELGELLPSIVDVACGSEAISAGHDGRWTLSRLGGSELDESMTLHGNAIADGDVLLLGFAVPAARIYAGDLCQFAVETSASNELTDAWWLRTSAGACLWSAAFAALILCRCDTASAGARAGVAAVLAVVAIVGSIVTSRVGADPLPTLALGLAAAAFGAVAGFLAVPGGPAAPNLFLAAAVCSAVSIMLVHLISGGATCFIALGTFCGTAGVAAAALALWSIPPAAVGAVLACASLALLAVAARLSILLTGLSPRLPDAADDACGPDTGTNAAGAARARRAHRTLTGLLAGFSATAASGVALLASSQRPTLGGVALSGAVAVVLLLRARQQVGPARTVTMMITGIACSSVSFTLAIRLIPQHALWVCPIVFILGGGAVAASRAGLAGLLSPTARRSAELAEYLAVAAAIPLGCWVADVFGLVRGLSLT